MIQLEHVSYQYPGSRTEALRDISLTIPAKQFCAVIGPNGAGKSTLAYLLAGFIPHFFHGKLSGEVIVADMNTRTTPLYELVAEVGLVLQNPFNQISGTKYTVREEIAFGLENLGIPREEMETRIEDALDIVGIRDLALRPPLALSGGQMQRVAIASILAMRPKILVLDEPTSQLDPIGSREVFSAVRALAESKQTTVIMIEHKLEWVAVFADRVVALADGEIVADGNTSEVLTNEALIEKGVGQTRYSQVARQARNFGFWPPERKLPVILEEAVDGFRQAEKYYRGWP